MQTQAGISGTALLLYFLTAVLDAMSNEHRAPAAFPTRKNPDTNWRSLGGPRSSVNEFFV
jgi:hypothetical protein